MSKLEELIQKYCPDGVEWVELGKVCDILDSQRKPISKGKRTSGEYPYYGANGIQDYVDGYIFDGTYLLIGEDGSVINSDNTPVLNWAQGKIWVNNHAHILAEQIESAKLRYLYFILQCTDISDLVHGVPPKLNQANLRNISIPLPPLPVQEEIVRILDAMTDLQENLEKELEERRRQYAFYRDKLLSFNELTTPPSWRIEWKQLGEIGKFYSGLSGKTKEDFTNGNAKFITYMNVFAHPILQIDVEDKVFIREGEKQHTIKYGDVLFTGSSETPEECGMTSVMTTKTEEDIYLNSFCFGYRFTSLDDICPSFMAHLFRSTNIRKQIVKTANGVTRFNVSKILCEKISIPLPPLSVQQEIVEKLDKMEELVSNIENELTDRKKQYTYYREQLLAFEQCA